MLLNTQLQQLYSLTAYTKWSFKFESSRQISVDLSVSKYIQICLLKENMFCITIKIYYCRRCRLNENNSFQSKTKNCHKTINKNMSCWGN